MAELKVPPSAVNVDLLAQVVHRHRRALDVPARPPVAKLRGPRGLVWSRATPQGEVERVLLGLRPHDAEQVLVPKLAQHGAPREMRQPSVTPVLADVEVQRIRAVRKAERVQLRRRREDLLDLVGHARHDVGLPPAQDFHVPDVDLGLAPGELAPVDTVAPGSLEQRIVDVRDVLHVLHALPVGLEKSHQHVEHGKRERVAHVPGLVRRHAADVERHRLARCR